MISHLTEPHSSCRHLKFFWLLLTVAMSGCGGGSGSSNFAPPPVPILTSISPKAVVPGGAAFTLTVSGNNFTVASMVDWNGAARQTTFVSAVQLTAQITATDIANGGTANITVVNSGSTSAPLTLTITAVNSSVQQIAPGGSLSRSTNYTLIGTLGPGSDNTAATSSHYKLQGGLTGAGESNQ